MSSNFNGWQRSGFAAKDAMSLTTSYVAHELTQDATVSRSQGVPDDAHLYDLCFEFSAMATSGTTPTQVSYYLARDSGGTQPLTEVFTLGIVKALGAAAATGGATQRMEVDFHSTSAVGASAYNSVYLIVLVDAGTATAAAYLNWRA